jgi:hypothetical protein
MLWVQQATLWGEWTGASASKVDFWSAGLLFFSRITLDSLV